MTTAGVLALCFSVRSVPSVVNLFNLRPLVS
jgi:hypothetical protein